MSDITETSLDQHGTLVSIAALIVDALESYGLAFQPILEEAGLDPNKVYDPSQRVPTRKTKKTSGSCLFDTAATPVLD